MTSSRTVLAVALALIASCGKSSPSKRDETPRPAEPSHTEFDAAAAVVVADAAPAEKPLGLRVELVYTSGEHSKDTHSFRYQCTIDGGRVVYAGPYGECVRGQCEHRQVSFGITNAQEKALLAEIERLGLFSEYEESRETTLLGHYESLSLKVALEDKSGAISVSGMAKAWGKDSSQDLSKEGRRWVGKVEDLRRAILEVVKPPLPDAH